MNSFFWYQHFLSKPDSHVPTNQQQFQSDGRRFRYRTTLTEGHRQQQQQQMQSQQHQWNETGIWGQPARRRQAHVAAQRDRKTEGRERRRYSLVSVYICRPVPRCEIDTH